MRIPTVISHLYTMTRGENSMSLKKRSLGYTMLCLMMFLVIGIHVRAEENNAVLGTLQVLPADAEVKESPDMDSATVGTLEAGTAVIVESQDGEWTKILYQNTEGYISDAVVSSFESYIAENSESLEQEMLSVAEEEQRITEEYELILKQRRTSLIWGIVIAILIIGIFGVGVVAAIKNGKEEEKAEGEELKEQGAEEEKAEEEAAEEEGKKETDTDIDIEEITDEEDGKEEEEK